MAIAGDTHNIPARPVKLVNGRVFSHCFTTNKPREIVEQDIEQAALRLLNGEEFELHCSGEQVIKIQKLLDEWRSYAV